MSEPKSASDNQDRLDLDAGEIIERFGGIRPAASKLGIAVTTVQGWKARGRIPDKRHEMVRAAAAKHGIDLKAVIAGASSAAAKADEPSGAKVPKEPAKAPSGKDSGKTPDAKPGRAGLQTAFGAGPITWTALFLASLAVAAAIFLPFSPPGTKAPATQTPPAGLASVEKKVAARDIKAKSATVDLARFERRIAALESGLETVKSRSQGVSAADLGALKADIARIAGELDGLAGRVRAVADQVAKGGTAVEGKASSAELDALGREAATLKATLAAMSAEQAALSARVAELAARRPAAAGTSGALALAVGQLEAALATGKPYKSALDRIQAIAGEDAVVAGALAPLGLRAERGIPTRAELRRRFERLLPDLAAAAPKGQADGMLGKIWARLAAIVVIRRVADGEVGKDASPGARAEAALGKGDFAAAVAALEGYGGAVEAWRRDARVRLAAEASVAALRAQALQALAAPTIEAGK